MCTPGQSSEHDQAYWCSSQWSSGLVKAADEVLVAPLLRKSSQAYTQGDLFVIHSFVFFLFLCSCFRVSNKLCRSWLLLLETYLFLSGLIDRLTICKVLFKTISHSNLVMLPAVLEHTIFYIWLDLLYILFYCLFSKVFLDLLIVAEALEFHWNYQYVSLWYMTLYLIWL